MPVYSFKERFVPLILDGSKRQTIRARRKHAPRVGQMAYLYYGMRTKHCRKLGDARIHTVHGILIRADQCMTLYSRPLELHEFEVATRDPSNVNLPAQVYFHYDRFAWNDGFRPEGSKFGAPLWSFELMIRFWKQTHPLPFIGDVIYW